jgi:hypothetical protein
VNESLMREWQRRSFAIVLTSSERDRNNLCRLKSQYV